MPELEKQVVRVWTVGGGITDVEVIALFFPIVAPAGLGSMVPQVESNSFRSFEVWIRPNDMSMRRLFMSHTPIEKVAILLERDFGRSKHSRIVATALSVVIEKYRDGVRNGGQFVDEVRFRCKQGLRT